MKTHILQLNKNDDAISVREKMAWCHNGRILLVLPPGGRMLESKLGLNLVKHQAMETGAQVALLTKNSKTKYYAKQLGIPVYKSLHQAQGSSWEPRKKVDLQVRKNRVDLEELRKTSRLERVAWLEHFLTRFLSLVIALLALIALIVLVVPQAEITIHPHVETQSIILPVTANLDAESVNLSTGTLPIELRQVIVNGRMQVPTTGQVMIPDHFATGAVRFTNVSDHSISIPAGTIVSTIGDDPVRFVTTQNQDVQIQPGQSAVLSARALTPGSIGNVPPDSIVSMIGDSGSDVMVTNTYATLGGTDAFVPTPSENDVQRLIEALEKELERNAKTELESTLQDGDYLILPSLEQVETIEKILTPGVGEPGRDLTLDLRMRFQAQVVTKNTFYDLAVPILDANIQEGYMPLNGTIQFDHVTTPTIGEDGHPHWLVQAQRKLQVAHTMDDEIQKMRGLPISTALEILGQSLELDEQPGIRITPSWWTRLPLLPMRIRVTTVNTG